MYNSAMKCAFLYNPQSGRGKILKKLDYIQSRLKTVYDEVEVCVTNGVSDLEEKIDALSQTCDALIFSGGDGTFHRVLNALKGRQVQLGYIPGGTVNDVARSLRIPRTVKGALNVITEGNSHLLDCMLVNGERYAMYIAAAGAFTSATYETPQNQKRALGMLAYALRVVQKNMKLQIFPIQITVGEERVQTDAVLILSMNGRSVAGFPVNRKGSMTDGVLEVVIIKQVQKPNVFQKIAKFFSLASVMLFGGQIKKKDVVYFKGERLEIQTTNEVVWDFDGEEGVCGDVTIEVLPKAVKLFVPQNNKKI